MTPPAYPVILTKVDWDRNKGTIAKTPNELGIGRAVWDAEAAFNVIDWSIQPPQVGALKILPHVNLIPLVGRYERYQQQVRDAANFLLNLANITNDVVQKYERAVTFPKPTIEHVRRMKDSATSFRNDLLNREPTPERMIMLAKKAKGYAKLNAMRPDVFCGIPALTDQYMIVARAKFFDDTFGFMVEAQCTTSAGGNQCPAGLKAQRLYDQYIKVSADGGNGANIENGKCKPLRQYFEKGQLINPPPNLQKEIHKAWYECYREAANMFDGPWLMWRMGLSIEDNSNFLLCAPLQA